VCSVAHNIATPAGPPALPPCLPTQLLGIFRITNTQYLSLSSASHIFPLSHFTLICLCCLLLPITRGGFGLYIFLGLLFFFLFFLLTYILPPAQNLDHSTQLFLFPFSTICLFGQLPRTFRASLSSNKALPSRTINSCPSFPIK